MFLYIEIHFFMVCKVSPKYFYVEEKNQNSEF